jgi:CO/xanthine dehydrogenase Mo-binding subunit
MAVDTTEAAAATEAARQAMGGIGVSLARKEDARFVHGQGHYVDDVVLPGMLHMVVVRSPYAHARIKGIDTSAAMAIPGVIAVVTGELLAQHKLAWMPTLSGDTQAVLATDKVRFQGQEVACVIAETKYIAEDAAAVVSVDYEPLQAITSPQQALQPGAVVIRDEKEGQTDNKIYHWEAGDKDATDAVSSGAARDVRVRRGPRPRDRQRHDLHDKSGAACASHALRDRRGAPRREDPDHLTGPRGRFRQQGADLSWLRGRHRRVAADRPSGQVD